MFCEGKSIEAPWLPPPFTLVPIYHFMPCLPHLITTGSPPKQTKETFYHCFSLQTEKLRSYSLLLRGAESPGGDLSGCSKEKGGREVSRKS